MKAKIGAKTVGRMQSGDIISDAEIQGFSARCWDTGAITYSLRYRTARGERKRILIGTHGNVTPDEARKIAKQRAGEVAFGHDPVVERRTAKAVAGNTVASIWDDYAKRELKSKRSAAAQQSAFDRLVRPQIGTRSIYDLRRGDMMKLFDTIEDNSGAVMSDAMLRYLGRCFRWHQIRDEDFTSPIIVGMARTSTKERARSRTLTDDEIRAVWKATETPASYNTFIRFLLLTAARHDEARKLTWNEIKGDDWTLPTERNKTKTELVRPLSKMVRGMLACLPRCDYVFAGTGGRPMGSPGRRKAKLDTDSGVTGWTLHDLRRTARSLMSRAGVSSDHAELCLGHVIGGVRGTYDRHEYYEEKRKAFEALAALIERIVNPPADNVTALMDHKARV
jgi:integrase